MKQTTERWYPYLGGVLFGAVYYVALRDFPMPKASKEILAAVVSMSAIAIGFLATAQSILVALTGRRMVRMLQQKGHFKLVTTYVTEAIYLSFGLALFSIGALVLDIDQPPPPCPLFVTVWVILGSMTAFACHRVLSLLVKIIPAED